jgi:hypothetical protein
MIERDADWHNARNRRPKRCALALAVLLAAGAASMVAARHGGPSTIRALQDEKAEKGTASTGELAAACQRMRDHVTGLLGPGHAVIVRGAMVIGGDLGEAELDRCYRETIVPAGEGMISLYFSAAPDEPVAILLFGSESSYVRQARRLLGRDDVSRHGHYRPHLRMVIANVEHGSGSLMHELTHALMAFDFPDAPDWIGEGLASLHEACRVSASPPDLTGLVGPRLAVLQEAIRRDRLPTVESMVSGDFRSGPAALNYAQARYFCLYLQERGVLAEFYRRLRDGQPDDPTGEKSVRVLLGNRDWAAIDADFRRWVVELKQ